MSIQLEKDKRLIEDLIVSKEVNPFIQRYQQLIFSVIDKQSHEINATAVITSEKKNQLMMDFIDNLLSDEAKLLHNYLHPKRLNVNETDLNRNELPMLNTWVHLQCVNFFSAKFIIDGILSKDINVIKTFFFSKKRPGCRELFSKWIFENDVYSGNNEDFQKYIDEEIQEYVNVLYADIDRFLAEQREISEGSRKRRRKLEDYENAELNTLAKYNFKGNFYSYFRDYVMRPYLRRKFFTDSHPVYIDDNGGDDEDDVRPIDVVSPEDSSSAHDARDYLEKIFQIMERTEAGRRQVEVLRLLNLETYDGEAPTDEEIAKILNLSIGNLRTIQSRALNTARDIAKTLKWN